MTNKLIIAGLRYICNRKGHGLYAQYALVNILPDLDMTMRGELRTMLQKNEADLGDLAFGDNEDKPHWRFLIHALDPSLIYTKNGKEQTKGIDFHYENLEDKYRLIFGEKSSLSLEGYLYHIGVRIEKAAQLITVLKNIKDALPAEQKGEVIIPNFSEVYLSVGPLKVKHFVEKKFLPLDIRNRFLNNK